MKRLLIVSLSILFASSTAFADWDPGDGHKMHYPQLPDPFGWDVPFNASGAIGSLADDWQCSQSGPVADIHFWVSAHQWNDPTTIPPIGPIRVAIREDIPDPDGSGPLFSQPGNLLWIRSFDPSDPTVQIQHYGTGDQGWLDPWNGIVVPSDHTEFYQINLSSFVDPYIQDVGKIYWLEIGMADVDPAHPVGWKTSGSPNFNDDAVYGFGTPGSWKELIDPTGTSLDLAFVITPEPTTMALLGLGGLLLRRKRKV